MKFNIGGTSTKIVPGNWRSVKVGGKKNIRHFTWIILLLLTVMILERNHCCVSMKRKVAKRTLLKCFRSADNAYLVCD